MKKRYLNECIGTHCKIVTKKPEKQKANVISGTITDINYDAGYLTVDSPEGIQTLSFQTIVAIKPVHST